MCILLPVVRLLSLRDKGIRITKMYFVMKQGYGFMAMLAAMSMLVSCSMDNSYSEYDGWIGGDGPSGIAGTGDNFDGVRENPFINTSEENVSTFSVDADGASYAIMRRYLDRGWNISSASVRIEEYLNYFTFNYPEPTDGNNIALNAETSTCPWDDSHLLLRLGIKGKSLSESQIPAANYVFLVDVSGSMNTDDKLSLFKSSLVTMLDYLSPDDMISIVTYSGEVKKLLEATKVKDAGTIKSAISKLSAGGSTAGGAAMEMAYEEALANYIVGGNNRVIMGTDGDFNVGVTSTSAIEEMVKSYASKGIYITVCGLGSGNLNDELMKKISIAGNGTYQFIDSENEMMKVFVNERERFVSVANDVKVQVTFDSLQVSSYRLIGYERRVMSSSDFEDDSKDAGEIGAGQTITALYEFVPKNGNLASGETIGTFDCNYKKALGESSVSLPTLGLNVSDGVSDEMSFASGVAAYGLVLLDSEYKGNATFDMALDLVKKGLSFDPNGYRAELVELIPKAAK